MGRLMSASDFCGSPYTPPQEELPAAFICRVLVVKAARLSTRFPLSSVRHPVSVFNYLLLDSLSFHFSPRVFYSFFLIFILFSSP